MGHAASIMATSKVALRLASQRAKRACNGLMAMPWEYIAEARASMFARSERYCRNDARHAVLAFVLIAE